MQVLQNNAPVTLTFSANNGGYLIPGLPPGNYLSRFVVPSGFAPVTPQEQAVLLANGSAVNLSFGQPVGTIAGAVFDDVNGDGMRQGSEPGTGGVDLSIYSAGPDGVFRTGDEIKVADAASAGNGAYLFVNQPIYAVPCPRGHAWRATRPPRQAAYSANPTQFMP